MFCYKCGAPMPDEAQSCPACGTPVQQSPASSPAGRSSGVASSQPGVTPAPSTQAWSAALNLFEQPPCPRPNFPAAPGYPAMQETDTKAIVSFVMGILGIFPLWILAGIPAVILGHLSKAEINRSMDRLKGGGMATAGLVMGYISLAWVPLVIIAAIAIPNLIRARASRAESTSVVTVRVLNTAQTTYATRYPQTGYAMSLAVLGPGAPPMNCRTNPNRDIYHACLIDQMLGCSSAGWCDKSGYRYHINAVCNTEGACSDYVITATPIDLDIGMRSFCSTRDGVIRSRVALLNDPIVTPEECKAWSPL